MRNLFLALVLANLSVAAWHYWFAERTPGRSVADRDLPGITLVHEVEPGVAVEPEPQPPRGAAAEVRLPRLPPATAADGDALPAAAERCISVGPFRELAQAAGASFSLRTAGYEPRQRVAEGEIWVGYWVHLELDSVEEANRILVELRANAVGDSYVIPGIESSIVSLGVFSEISRAGRRREELRELGYEPTVSDSTRRATVYWVDVTLEPGQNLDFEALQTPGRIIRLEQRACGGP